MAASTGSGAIEYHARVLLALRSVPGESDLVHVRIPKNKLGPRTPDDDEKAGIYLRLDRASQILAEDRDYVPPVESRPSGRDAKAEERALGDAARLAVILAKRPGKIRKEVFRAIGAATPGGMGTTRYEAACGKLGDGFVEARGPRTAKPLYVDGSQVPEAILNLIPLGDRQLVTASRPRADARLTEDSRGSPSLAGESGAPPLRDTSRAPLRGAGEARVVRVPSEDLRKPDPGEPQRGSAGPETDGSDGGRP